MESLRTIRYTSTPISGTISTNTNQPAFPQPDRSLLRKMSTNTVIRIQNQITQRKISRMVQKIFSNG